MVPAVGRISNPSYCGINGVAGRIGNPSLKGWIMDLDVDKMRATAAGASDQLLHILRRDACRRLVQLRADPAHHGRRVRQLALLEEFHHAQLPALAFLALLVAIDNARRGHVHLTLLSTNSTGTH